MYLADLTALSRQYWMADPMEKSSQYRMIKKVVHQINIEVCIQLIRHNKLYNIGRVIRLANEYTT